MRFVPPAADVRMPLRWMSLGLVLACMGNAACCRDDRCGRDYVEPDRSHDGSSEKLSRTVVLPTLDEPLPKGKNAVWCASFQMAWDRFAMDALKQPPQVAGAEALCARLNAAPFKKQNLATDSYYAAAGFVKDGIVETITRKMESRFPSVPAPALTSEQEAIIAYAYLNAGLKFTIPFFDNRSALVFRDSANAKSAVASFGIRHEDEFAYENLREQIEVLYADFDADGRERDDSAARYVVDPCRHSSPCQIVLACVPCGDTLGATLEDVERRINTPSREEAHRRFGPNDVFLAPTQCWRLDHHFDELEGTDRRLMNPGFEVYWIAEAMQTVEFKLDRSGAELQSESSIVATSAPRHYVFDRPFLIYMKRRGAEKPFLVVWIDNGELLSPFPGP